MNTFIRSIWVIWFLLLTCVAAQCFLLSCMFFVDPSASLSVFLHPWVSGAAMVIAMFVCFKRSFKIYAFLERRPEEDWEVADRWRRENEYVYYKLMRREL